jgi:pimeloyl-ACP methyl ester carboxylesterase
MARAIDPSEITAKGCRWVRAADGRIIEYSVSGSQRTDARVLVSGYFAGMPELTSWKEAYRALNIKVIDLSFPGLGLSSLNPGRKISEWPQTDVVPVLEAEGVEDFSVYGSSYGSNHALAVAQYFGPTRVQALGLRVPYLGLPLSIELGLPDGQPRFPSTEEVLRNTFKIKLMRVLLNFAAAYARMFSNPSRIALSVMKSGVLGGIASSTARLCQDYPEEFAWLSSIPERLFAQGGDSMLYMMAKDVALDLPGLDPRNIRFSGDRVVVWYAADDEDCPPSHGEWLAQHYSAKTRILDGYGHGGGALVDHPQFLEDLMGRP